NTRFTSLFAEQDFLAHGPRLGETFRNPAVLDAFQGAFRQGQAANVSVLLRAHGYPAPRYFTLSVSPLRKDGGPIYGAVGVFHDLTELKQAEQIRIDFVANVSHELRTPLTVIKGYTDTLGEDLQKGRPESVPKFVEAIGRNVQRLLELINDLLDLS